MGEVSGMVVWGQQIHARTPFAQVIKNGWHSAGGRLFKGNLEQGDEKYTCSGYAAEEMI
jgi:hypothetical protein